jgi:hypothetical protein
LLKHLLIRCSTVQDGLDQLRLQVAAQDGIRVLKDFLPSARSSPKGPTQQHEQIEGNLSQQDITRLAINSCVIDEDAVVTDVDTVEPNVLSNNQDISMTASGADLEVPIVPVNGPRNKATPEFMIPPPPSFHTPKSLVAKGMPSPGTVGTIMPDTPGFNRYDGPAQMPQKPLFAENPKPVDENSNKRAKRARYLSIIPSENLILSPITEDTNEQSVLEPVKQIDKILWRETWEQRGKPGTLEDFARKQKAATLHSTDADGFSRSICTRLSNLIC